MLITAVPISIVGSALVILTFFLLKAYRAPKRIEQVYDLLRKKNYPQAIKGAKALLNKDPRSVDAHYLLAKAYLEDGRPGLALVEFKAINQIGRFGDYCSEETFHKEAGDLFKAQNQIVEALKEYLLLIQLEPKVADHYYEVGELLERRGNADKSFGYYKKAIKIDPEHSRSHCKLGFLLYRAQRPSEAKFELNQALKYDKENCQAHYHLGKLLRDNQDYIGALKHFEKAQRSSDLKVKTLIERGGCYLSLNNYERAVSELSRAVRLASNEGNLESLYSRYFLALAYEKSRNLDKAIEQWERIYALRPSFQDVAEKLSQYQEIRVNDRVKDYLTSNQPGFHSICQAIAHAMKLEVREMKNIRNGCQIIAAETESKWRNVRKMPRLIWFLRVPEPVNENTIKKLLEEMKTTNISRGAVFTSSNFTQKAVDFAETRPIDLYNNDKLQGFLKQVHWVA
jgi:tetratricopeptide (TPR) repeat protein